MHTTVWVRCATLAVAGLGAWAVSSGTAWGDGSAVLHSGQVPTTAAGYASHACGSLGGGPYADQDVWSFVLPDSSRDFVSVTASFDLDGDGAADTTRSAPSAGGISTGAGASKAWIAGPAGATLLDASAVTTGSASPAKAFFNIMNTCPAVAPPPAPSEAPSVMPSPPAGTSPVPAPAPIASATSGAVAARDPGAAAPYAFAGRIDADVAAASPDATEGTELAAASGEEPAVGPGRSGLRGFGGGVDSLVLGMGAVLAVIVGLGALMMIWTGETKLLGRRRPAADARTSRMNLIEEGGSYGPPAEHERPPWRTD
jgi:hypothetical protein